MTTNSLLRVMATALVLPAACKSDFPAGSYEDDGGPQDAPVQEAAVLRADGTGTGPTKPDGLDLTGLTALTVTTSGGMPGLPGNACSTDNENALTLVFQTRVLSWEHCAIDSSTGNPYRKTETQLLTDYEVTAARLLLDLLSTNYNRTACGADKGLATLDLTFANRVEKYQDDFYAGCPSYAPVDGRTYLHYMDLITSWLDELARDSHPLPSSFINLAVVSDLDPFPSSAAMTAATAACGAAVNPSYDVTAATQTIKWSSCASGSTGYGLQIGGRVLSESEFARVMQSWSAIQLGATGDCSTPRSQKSLQLTTAPGVHSYVYLNDVTPCSRDTASAYSMYVVGLDDLAALLASLASGSPPGDGGVPDLSPAPKNCSDITDQQSCENATCTQLCEWSGPFMKVTSAPGGPLLTEVRVTSGWCTPAFCSTWGSSSCSSLSVTTTDRTPAIGTTCDLVAVATDGRTQSFRITVVQSGPAYNSCCGYGPAPLSGRWVTFASLAFDPPEVVVDFNSDGGTSDSGPTNPDGRNDAAPALQGVFVPTGSMSQARAGYTATLLPNGKVLVAGGHIIGWYLASAELYDPATGTFADTGSMTARRGYHTATLLPNGMVLIAGGEAESPAGAELYDPSSGTFTATGSMTEGRVQHTATLLTNGKVLVAGGLGNYVNWGDSTSAELYDPSAGTFTATGSMTWPRQSHTATLLPSGKVLIAGGSFDSELSADLYDPAVGTFAATSSMVAAREMHTATLLPSGKVLIAGGSMYKANFASAELYDPAAGTFTATGNMTLEREHMTATLLPSGKVLITGGSTVDGYLASAELYDPTAGIFTATGSMTAARDGHTATFLPSGKVLIAGGWNDSDSGSLASAELYQ